MWTAIVVVAIIERLVHAWATRQEMMDVAAKGRRAEAIRLMRQK